MSVISEKEAELDQVMHSFLSFTLDGEFFAVDVKKVIEILEVPAITKIPLAPKYLSGIINLRGKVLPLVDTKVKFGLEPVEFTVDTCVIVMEIKIEDETIQIGTLVDSVLEVMEVADNAIQPSPSVDAKYKLEFIRGMYRKDDDFILLLNLDEVFSIEEMNFLQDQNIEQTDGQDIKEESK